MTTALGLPGYTFEDLHRPERLASLYDRFCEEVRAADPAFWREWDAYRQAPDAPRPPLALSNLLIAMAPHVSRFLQRLFEVDAPAEAIAESTRGAGRPLPLQGRLRPPPRAAAAQGRRARLRLRRRRRVVERMIADQQTSDRELAVARAGCALLDRERSAPAPSTQPLDPASSPPVPTAKP